MRTSFFAPSPLMTKLLMYPSSLRMRAISSFNFDAGMSTRECLAETALRIRANMSAIGSVIRYNSIFDCQLPIADWNQWEIGDRQSALSLPTTFHDSRNLPG